MPTPAYSLLSIHNTPIPSPLLTKMPDDTRQDWDTSYGPLAELTHEHILQTQTPVELYGYNVEDAPDSKADLPAPMQTETDVQDAQVGQAYVHLAEHVAEHAEPSTATPTVTGKKTRSREGCLVCRARRIKCDNGTSQPRRKSVDLYIWSLSLYM